MAPNGRMNLTHRPASRDDFPGVYRACYAHDLRNDRLRAIIEREWNIFLSNPTTITMVVEGTDLPPDNRIVGCTQLVFVTDRLVDHLMEAPPHPNQHASRPLPDGT